MIYTNSFESIQEAVNYIGAKSPNVAYVAGCLNPNCLVYTDLGEDVDIIFLNNNGFIRGIRCELPQPEPEPEPETEITN